MYRDTLPAPGTACRRHGNSPAVATCASCLATICETCLVYDHALPRCAACARARRRTRRVVATVGAMGVAAAVVAAGTWMVRHPGRVNVRPLSPEAAMLESSLEAEPCDRGTVIKLGEMLNSDGESREALRVADGFFKKCGPYPRLLWVTYTAHEDLSEWDAAIADATKLIEHAPEDPDYRWWRGRMYEEKGDDASAVADYRKTLELNPLSDQIPFDLSRLLEKMGKPCEAIVPVQAYVKAHAHDQADDDDGDDDATDPAIEDRLGRLGLACLAQQQKQPGAK